MNLSVFAKHFAMGWLLLGFTNPGLVRATDLSVFNVKDYGATGKKADDARPALQKAIDACAAAGGGAVYLPPGDYTSGTLHLRSHVTINLEAGATLFASADPAAYDYGKTPSKAALFYGESVENISLTGRGTVDGQAEYDWRPDDFERAFKHKTLMQSLGKSLLRPFPKGFPKREIFPHLLYLERSTDIHVTGLNFLHSPSWTMALYGCERAVFDHLYLYSSLKEAVWADGIDLDGCKDVFISNCVIETGDDCIIFISTDAWGPALPCENVTVSNCRLSSASAGIKFSEGNRVAIRKILVNNTVLANVNRGFVFNITQGGAITDVVLSDLTIDCNRFDWFWAGDAQPFSFRIARTSEINEEPPIAGEPGPGSIRNLMIRNVIARAKGTSRFLGHAESWLDGISVENMKLFVATDPSAPFDQAVNALEFRYAKNLKLKDIEVTFEKPGLETWKSALSLEDVTGLQLDGFAGRGAWPERGIPAVLFDNVSDAVVTRSRALEGTQVFLKVTGPASRDIWLRENDFRKAKVLWQLDKGVKAKSVKALANLAPR